MTTFDVDQVPATTTTTDSQENVHHMRRETRDGRVLWYQLTVLQQPECARACGSGFKANSDRRPVDPPPVVEIRIFEGPSIEEGKDITFDYNANFFLYASLELARPMAQPIGRLHTSLTSNPPVLTGVPASGVAYLDRPTAAGYFIFPDLSVRHEGYFRLSFSLYEACKEEKDFDMDQPMGEAFSGVLWRMNIKTVPFNVYSAKKFPGLMESTELSKTVANQGCRVRIRRDVRMRKRDTKSNSGRDGHDGDRIRSRATPPSANGRHRSQSNSSENPSGYETDDRRHAGVDSYGAPLPPVYEAPPLQQHTPMTFAGDHGAPHYAAPRHYPPLNSSYPPSPYVKQEASYSGYQSVRATPQPQEAAAHHHSHQGSSSTSPYGSMEADSRRTSYTPSHHHSSSISSQPSLAPLKIASLMSPLPPIEADTDVPPVSSAHIAVGAKRHHDAVFGHSSKPLYDGNRPVDPHFRPRGYSQMEPPEQLYSRAVYSRANGKIGVVAFNQYQ